jgi:hypothetical protein
VSLATTTGGLFFLADEGQDEGAAVGRGAVLGQEDALQSRTAGQCFTGRGDRLPLSYIAQSLWLTHLRVRPKRSRPAPANPNTWLLLQPATIAPWLGWVF